MDRPPVTTTTTRVATRPEISAAAQKVLKNTYLLLAATLLWSAICARVSMVLNLPYPGLLIVFAGFYGVLFAINRLRNSAWSVGLVFVLTGFMGYTLGPILNHYVRAIPDGGAVITSALTITGVTFLGLSAYVWVTRQSFRFMQSFLFVGVLAAFGLGLVAYFFNLTGLSLAVSAIFVFLSSGLILWQTGEIVNDGETNYVLATVTLYVQILNLFMSLLSLLGGSRR